MLWELNVALLQNARLVTLASDAASSATVVAARHVMTSQANVRPTVQMTDGALAVY